MQNRTSNGKSRRYASSPPWHTVESLWTPWTQLMPDCYGFARWTYGGNTVHGGRATVMYGNKPALFRIPVRPGCFIFWNHPLPGERRFNTVYPDSMRYLPASLRCGSGGPRKPHCSDAGTENRDSVNEAYFSGPQGSWSVHVCCLHLKMEFCWCARGRQWCGIVHYHWWTASIKPRLLFSRAGYASWGLSLSSV